MLRSVLPLFALIALLFASPAIARDDILTTAASNGSFNTLVNLVVAADLDEALQGDGEFTVFAPTDVAFAKLPAETLQSLLDPANRDELASILKYHVVPEEISVARRTPSHRIRSAETLLGEELQFNRQGQRLFVNSNAEVVTRNIKCSNGLIQVIDAVLLPPEKGDSSLLGVAEKAGSFSTLLAAIEAAGLQDALRGDGPLTVLAPTDDAFKALPEGTLESLLEPENKDQLAAILQYHVIAGRVTAKDAVAAGEAETLQGESVSIAINNGSLQINNANVVTNDIETSNGIIHVIDAVLLPGQNSEEGDASTSNEEHHSTSTDSPSDRPEVIVIRGSWDDNIVRDGLVADRIEVRIGGGGTVRLTNVRANEIETSIGGGSSVFLTGSVDRHESRVAGGAALRAAGLESRTTVVSVAGGGDAQVNATELLDVSANGGADVRYVSTDAEIKKQVNKYATLRPIDH